MKFFLYIPGMPVDGSTISSDKSLGGSETAGYYVAHELKKRGHDVVCFTNVKDEVVINGIVWHPIGPSVEGARFGVEFERYAKHIPHDVLIMQRAAGCFANNYASKLNYFWSHDLALQRFAPQINQMLWNTDRMLGVSDWHTKQINDVYKIDNDFLGVLRNGVDLSLFNPADIEKRVGKKIMLYTSRPERGLENLVKPGGIMEQIKHLDDVKLVVACYDNTTEQMAQYYQMLFQRCNELPNVVLAGPQPKQRLADMMCNAWLHVYPTEFEETSCITAMETQAAGLPIVTTETGALVETLNDAGVCFTEIDKFAEKIELYYKDQTKWETLHRKAMKKREAYTWDKSVDELERLVDSDFKKLTSNPKTLFEHFVYNSDFVAAKMLSDTHGFTMPDAETLGVRVSQTTDFYQDIAVYNINKGDKHMLGDGRILDMPRLMPIFEYLDNLPNGSRVLDYGCCVGQITSALAKKYPGLDFVGVDISYDQIQIAKDHVAKHNISNAKYKILYSPDAPENKNFDLVLCLDTLEHIWDYEEFLVELEACCKIGGKVVLSTPIGPIESQRNEPEHPIEHLHHFEEEDIRDLIGKKDKNFCKFVYQDTTCKNEIIGSYVWGWEVADHGHIGEIDYDRKLLIQKPRQLVSCCIITKDVDYTINQTIESCRLFVDEFIVGVDGDVEKLKSLIHNQDRVSFFEIASPVEIGFDAARNLTIERAKNDWILWIDSDETFRWPERTFKLLRNNMFDAYTIAQHHFTADPPSLLKTDFPCRLFRRSSEIKFYGIVHEHPEKEMNHGPGKVFMLPQKEVAICHNGYDTEEIRRIRFSRNLPLMRRDRETYPGRILGQHLWVRDLMHLNRFELEKYGAITHDMIEQCKEALEIWESFIDRNLSSRLIVESIPYISEAVNLLKLPGAYSFRLCADLDKGEFNSEPQILSGLIPNKEVFKKLFNMLVDQKALDENQKYL